MAKFSVLAEVILKSLLFWFQQFGVVSSIKENKGKHRVKKTVCCAMTAHSCEEILRCWAGVLEDWLAQKIFI